MTDQEATHLCQRAACPDSARVQQPFDGPRRVINETGCEVSISHITGDIVCQVPGPECDCLICAITPS